MPVDYTIASRNALANTPTDFTNMLAQYQMMGARATQQQLAQQQLEEYERARREDEMVRQYYSQQGVDPFARSTFAGLASKSPTAFFKAMPAYSGMYAEQAREAALRGSEGRETALQPYKLEEARGKGREASAKAGKEESAYGRDLLRGAYLAHSPQRPGAFEQEYAKIFPELPESIQRKLGPRPTVADLEPYIVSGEEFTKRREPRMAKPEEMIVTGTGREGEFYREQPTYVPPNAMVTNRPELNAFAAQGRMPPSVDEMNAPLTPQEQIIQRGMKRRALINQVPPEDRPRVESQLDLYETVKAANDGFDRLATAGGIPVAGQTTAKNWQAKLKTSGAGLALGNMSDTQVAEEYNNLRTISGVMRQRFTGAIGLTARQMDAAKEVEALEKILGASPSAEGLASAKRRLNTINQLLGTGETSAFESPRPSRGKAGESTPKPLKGDETIDFGDMP
jgi:hypothetical protein